MKRLTSLYGWAALLISSIPMLGADNSPVLAISRTVTISWPITNGGGFKIEWSPTADSEGPWTALEAPLTISAERILATVDESYQSRFFRLTTRVGLPLSPNLVWIPAGSFTMGSPASELGRTQGAEDPLTSVQISHGFFMGRFEVTQAEYLELTGLNPSVFVGDPHRPVESTKWNDALTYCSMLNSREAAAGRLPVGYEYRLPTEAEWEYACRAGTTTRFYWGDDLTYSEQDNYTWNNNNSQGTTHPVGQKLPNPWGLYDMNGNVEEFTSDWYGGYPGGSVVDPRRSTPSTYISIRGGDWNDFDQAFRCAQRYVIGIDETPNQQGFRVVLARSN